MNTSKDRMVAIGNERIKEKAKILGLSDKEVAERQNKFLRKVTKFFGAGKAFILGDSPTKCEVCNRLLHFNNSGQIVRFCSKKCRRMRHNKKRGR